MVLRSSSPMSSDDRSWRRRMGRSKSTGGEAHFRASPPDSVPAAPPSPGNPPIPVPPSSTTTTTSTTPPKKAWERHYKSFLTKRVLGQSPKSSASTTEEDHSGRSGKFPGSRRLFRNRSKSGEVLVPTPKMPDMPVLTHAKSNEADLAVRGGNFFSSVFARNKSDESGESQLDGPVSPSQRQRIKSMERIKSVDALDTTLKGGLDKAYHSPKPASTKTYNELDSPVHGGVPTARASRSQGHLPAALASSSTKSREMKKAFTEFHNSATYSVDSTSAYLGDDPSIRTGNYLAMPKRTSIGVKSEHNLAKLLSAQSSKGSSLPTVSEDLVAAKSVRVLKPVQGPESWEAGRRYLIAPAALSSCPLTVLSALSDKSEPLQDYTDSCFGTVELGMATVKYVGTRIAASWLTGKFLLKQNYLMEYDVNASTKAAPRGFAHLQYARAYPHHDFPDALELQFYASPCARADKRVLLIRLANREDRDRWIMCLNDAASLTIRDLYDYDEETVFGRGRYAVVYPACRRREPKLDDGEGATTLNDKQHTCALKVIDKNEFWRRVVKVKERADTLVRETSVQATLTAKCAELDTFLQIRGIFETSDNFVIELELLEGTDLFHYISSKDKPIDEDEAAQIMLNILTSLDAMARVGVAHRDIKPANILMCDKDRCGVSVKVADFGMAGFMGVDGHLRGRCGTPGYVAPEIFSTAVHGGYGNKVDVFSAGVTLYVLLCGYEPFYGESDAELIAANKAAIVEYPECDWSNISLGARDLVQKMLERDPKDRISAKDALEHPWIVNRLSSLKSEQPNTVEESTIVECTTAMEEEGTACTIS